MKYARLAALPALSMFLLWQGCGFQAARAQETAASPCGGSATEADMLACHETNFTKAQAELEELVKELRTNFAYDGTEHTAALDFAQETWKAFAGAECDLMTHDSRGGTAYDLHVVECLTKLHVKRIAEIQERLDTP